MTTPGAVSCVSEEMAAAVADGRRRIDAARQKQLADRDARNQASALFVFASIVDELSTGNVKTVELTDYDEGMRTLLATLLASATITVALGCTDACKKSTSDNCICGKTSWRCAL